MRLLGSRWGKKVLNALREIPQGSRSLWVVSLRGGTVDQLDICGCETKRLVRESESG
jgi:hypothetical protein